MSVLEIFRFVFPLASFICVVVLIHSPLILKNFRTDKGKVGPRDFTMLFSKKNFLNEQGLIIRERLRLIINWSFFISLLSFLFLIYKQNVVVI
ncbi:hypothetical protein VIBR0546_05817 [Vibrio brasiliensis LMG 20546]|uniref:Uncharacterized protein n=1 Tax=Vibrio brasiliensis LMG 20546 TaxID=945543 RepID=E8LYZ7_9VIBR|nr:hypothetical protein VIBR0546_05817 [Vibrio brasiliensis LMG 20546]